MMRKTLLIPFLAVAAVLTIGQAECPGEWPTPPFDTTGVYAGTWQGTTNEEKQQTVAACPLTITLTQDLTANYPNDHGVKGTVDVDYSCLVLPEWLGEIPANTVQVAGLLEDNGKLTLLSGGCGTGLCLVMALAGEGVDADADGAMDAYAGSWSFTILLAGIQPFGVTGTFEVASID